jgi:hypothetical protein
MLATKLGGFECEGATSQIEKANLRRCVLVFSSQIPGLAGSWEPKSANKPGKCEGFGQLVQGR